MHDGMTLPSALNPLKRKGLRAPDNLPLDAIEKRLDNDSALGLATFYYRIKFDRAVPMTLINGTGCEFSVADILGNNRMLPTEMYGFNRDYRRVEAAMDVEYNEAGDPVRTNPDDNTGLTLWEVKYTFTNSNVNPEIHTNLLGYDPMFDAEVPSLAIYRHDSLYYEWNLIEAVPLKLQKPLTAEDDESEGSANEGSVSDTPSRAERRRLGKAAKKASKLATQGRVGETIDRLEGDPSRAASAPPKSTGSGGRAKKAASQQSIPFWTLGDLERKDAVFKLDKRTND
ncbi:hypothetical protein LTR17_026648 [Elasticomyces elasticus]|nr:hypothetical protein LTR17_026648 [Elasticomyces elasticus]